MFSSPAAERNKEPILNVLRELLPSNGLVLEIASGTGQHVEHFAYHLPDIDWQPTEVDAAGCAVVAARLQASVLTNVRAPLVLDAMSRNWPPLPVTDAILCINLIHIAPWEAAVGLVRSAGQILARGGLLVLYGPYKRGGKHTAPSNEEFDRSLQARNPLWGVRDLEAVTTLAANHELRLLREFAMPANNLTLAFRRL